MSRTLAAATDGAPEIMPGVVFYHTHTHAVETPQVFVGVCPRGATLPQAAGPVRVILALLAPVEMEPDAYLRLLSVIAQLVRTEATVDALVDSVSPEDARDLLFADLRDSLSGEAPTADGD